uniref:Uncharacterized protein n=1 Tax=Rhizophora mucronata TaxID=61149 RepID=A0A2P2LHD0_RHIMU
MTNIIEVITLTGGDSFLCFFFFNHLSVVVILELC